MEKETNDLFSLLPPEQTNVDFVNKLTETERFNQIQYLYFNNGAGVAAGDINNDGLADLYFTSNQNPNKLYLNKGDLKFEDITTKAGVEGNGDWKTGVTMADVNGDGFLDIYVCQVGKYKVLNGRNQLFINQGDLTFKEEASSYGLDFQGFSTQAAFFDYDLDGDLDMYLLNHSVHSSRSYGPVTLRLDRDSLAGDRLYRNDVVAGKMFFKDVTAQSGIYGSQIGYGLGVSISDINNDGWPDVYICNDFHEDDYLYINNGNGTFTDRFRESIQHTSRSAMGNDAADINNDGLTDLIVLDMLPEEEKIRKQSGGEDDDDVYRIKMEYGYGYQFVRNTLHLNLGGGLFSEIGRLAGVFSTDWSWSPLFCDVDNDGYKDLFITTGIYRRSNDLNYIRFLTDNEFFEAENNKNTPDSVLYNKMPLYPQYNYIYKNKGDLTFSNMGKEWGFNTRSYSNGSAYADLDNDGDLELISNNINEHAYIYRNNAVEQGNAHFLRVGLKGPGLNSFGIGTRVTIYYDGNKQVAEFFPTRGFMSASAHDLHFGLGEVDRLDSLFIRWPDLSEQNLADVNADQYLVLNYENAVKSTVIQKGEAPLDNLAYRTTIPGLDYRHIEDDFEDFKHEVLVPHTLFAEGPALEIADFNGDGLDDLFAGCSKGQPSALYYQQLDGSFKPAIMPIFIKDLYFETVDAAAFDADGDKDVDLYLVRGGSEVSQGDPTLSDRLLINDGTGVFKESESMPPSSNNGSCVAPCDYDNDGDIDLFVGSRSVPGAYGLSPRQMLLENDGHGHFTDVTEKRMKRHGKIGMITDASWADYDNDGDKDLILAGEWLNITVLNNNNGDFTDGTDKAGLGETSGWWKSINVTDLDNDGDMDIVAGNHGLNSIVRASVKEPIEMYLNDFDKNGTLDQIICSYHEGVSYPVASLDQLNNQMPGIKQKYQNYSDFAGKTAREIFGRRAISGAIIKKAVLLESCIFLNKGDGAFESQKLPVAAQFSPIRDILVTDIDKDGQADIIVAGNDYSVKPSYGRQDASYGWFLLNNTAGGYNALMPSESGFKVLGDARKVKQIVVSGKKYIVVALNNSEMQVFRMEKD